MGQLFAKQLQILRERSGKSQSQLADEANSKGDKKITQSILVQYESGKVALPDVDVLNQVAEALETSCGKFVLRVAMDVVEKYKEKKAKFDEDDENRFKIWRRALAMDAGSDQDDGTSPVLKSMQEFMRDAKLYDIDSLATWQKEYDANHSEEEKLKVFWVIAPNFVDNANPKIKEAVLNNVVKGTHYFYFVKEGDVERGGPFYVLLDSLGFLAQQNNLSISRDQINKFVHPVELAKEIVGLIPSDVVIANPQSTKPEGFRSIRAGGVPVYGVPIEDAELSRLIGNYLSYFGTEKVFPAPPTSKK